MVESRGFTNNEGQKYKQRGIGGAGKNLEFEQATEIGINKQMAQYGQPTTKKEEQTFGSPRPDFELFPGE